MNWPNIRKFPVSARALIAIYTMLMGSILVVALALSSWHHGLVTDKGIQKKAESAPAAAPVTPAIVKPDDGESSGVVIEADSEAVKVKPQDWFIYENFKLGHTHLNGQSLVYFTLIVLFLMSTASERAKILWGVLLAFSVVLHTFGLFFMHKEAFALMLRFSGALLSLSITVMCAYIFVDTVKRPQAS
ncbi:hypothetical protein [Turneriella parva]|uniref:Uncharacterized protein n=1 Tax=Turneriella parva (strain ATCC BAA-1111 / DSM 21527 / NCTC 11395 / H) TaxID=869212 RepID=I4B3H2_TURPD|nr:hypothetical protein [Turneriella parva]AFM11829.1 hypothetical protein Turpa_1181 [Turneriella parva DSM 21527]